MDDFLPGRCVGRHAVTGNATCHGIIQRIPLPCQFHESVGGDAFRIFYRLKKVCVGLDSFFGRTKPCSAERLQDANRVMANRTTHVVYKRRRSPLNNRWSMPGCKQDDCLRVCLTDSVFVTKFNFISDFSFMISRCEINV